MIFDAPLLLFLAPARRRWRSASPPGSAAADASGWRGAGRPRSDALGAGAGRVGAGGARPRRRCSRCVVALAGPRWGRTEITTEIRALSLVFAVDISRSMLAEDVAPNRLQRAVREARRLIQDLEGDRLGLIAFAGRSYILAPLTVDGGAIRMYLDALDPDLASEGGTNLSSVLAQGGAAPRRHHRRGGPGAGRLHRRRGARHAARDRRARPRRSRRPGVRLIVVAEGGAAPTRIPIRDSAGTLLEYKQDDDGTVIQTQRRDDILRAMVDAAEGTLVPSEAPRPGRRRARSRRRDEAEPDLGDAHGRSGASRLDPRPGRGAAAARRTRSRARGRRWSASRACCCSPGTAAAQRPTAGGARARGRRSRPRRRRVPEGGRHRAARKRHGVLQRRHRGARGRAARRGARRAGRGGQVARPRPPVPRALQPRARRICSPPRPTPPRQEELLDDAADRLRQALLLQPSSERAKWNLELAERRRPPPPPQGGGGGGGTPPPSGGPQAAAAAEPPSRSPGICRRARRSRSSTRWSGASGRRGRSSSGACRTGSRRSEGLVSRRCRCSRSRSRRSRAEPARSSRPSWTRTGSRSARSSPTRCGP